MHRTLLLMLLITVACSRRETVSGNWTGVAGPDASTSIPTADEGATSGPGHGSPDHEQTENECAQVHLTIPLSSIDIHPHGRTLGASRVAVARPTMAAAPRMTFSRSMARMTVRPVAPSASVA